jgi:UDP-N-acetylmuramyl pentapeptide phosphotransferase/UDP-N-acetylglucosamine-1-phosphate transferase
MTYLTPLFWMAGAGSASALLIFALLRSGRTGALDQPNQRSLHARPVPRSGGLGILLAMVIGFAAAAAPPVLVAGTLLVACISWLDDQHRAPILFRFAGHFAAAGIAAWGGLLPDGPAWLLPLALFGIVWMTNLYNFMDGSDGLAGGMAVFGFGTLALAAASAGAQMHALVAACTAAGAAGFLLFNFHPARIFMGDTGSIPLGYLAAVLGLDGVRIGIWPLWFPLLAFAPFVADASVTLLRRLLRGEKIWQAHREHYYQRLVQLGWGHRRTALAEYVLMVALGALALTLLHADAAVQPAGLGVSLLLLAALMWRVDFAWSLHGTETRT